MKIDTSKLTALHEYLVAGGSSEQEDVAKQLGVEPDDEATTEAYVEALKTSWPDIYGEPEKPSTKPAAKKAAKQVKTVEPSTYRLRKPDGTVAALEVVASKNGTVVLQEPRPTDIVTLTIKGKPVTVDLIRLAEHPTDSPHGIPNSKLIELAQLAKA